MGDYVGDITPHAKNHGDRPSGASLQLGEMSLSRDFLVFFLFSFFPFFVTRFLLNSRAKTAEPIFTLFDLYDVIPGILHS